MINVVSWAASYGNLDHRNLVEAGFTDKDVTACADLDGPELLQVFDPSDERKVPFAATRAAAVLDAAWTKAGLRSARNRLDGRGDRIRYPDTALVVGSSLALADEACEATENPDKRMGPYALSKLRGNALTAPLAIRFGLGGGSHCVSAASATGGAAMVHAASLIRAKQADRVAVVCLDEMRHNVITSGLGSTGASSLSKKSQPLSVDRNGMRPITAAVAMILETDESCQARGQGSMAQWVGGCVRHECHHLMVPIPSCDALIEASLSSLEQAGLTTGTIDWVSLHATGTRVWDDLEVRCAKRLFGSRLPHLSAFKRSFGHTMGAAGLLEAGLLCEGLASRRLPPWPCPTDPALELTKPLKIRSYATNAMMWSAGMGGDVAANIFSASA